MGYDLSGKEISTGSILIGCDCVEVSAAAAGDGPEAPAPSWFDLKALAYGVMDSHETLYGPLPHSCTV